MKRLILILLLSGCTVTTTKPVTPPPDDAPGTCATVTINLERLGGCDLDVSTYESNCLDSEEAGEEDRVVLRKGCLTAAKSCEEFWACGTE